MKKLVFGIIATVLLSNLSFGQDTIKFIPANMYGAYHNELLQIYFEKYSSGKDKDIKVLYYQMLEEFEKLHPNVVSDEEKSFYENRLNEVFGSNTKISEMNFNEIYNKAAKEYYPPAMQDFFIDILKRNDSPEVTNDKIKILKENKSLTPNDLNEIAKFESIYAASQIFWKDRFSSTDVSKYRCNPHHQILLADAFGLFMGGWTALILSAAVQESIDQHGGNCI